MSNRGGHWQRIIDDDAEKDSEGNDTFYTTLTLWKLVDLVKAEKQPIEQEEEEEDDDDDGDDEGDDG